MTLQSPIATGLFVRSPLRLLLCSLALTGTTLLTAAPGQAQRFYRPLTFEQNRGQAPKEVKWLGHVSSDRALFIGNGATFLHRDENDTRAMTERQPVPVDNFQDRRSSHGLQATPKARRPRQKPDLIEGTTPAGRRRSSGPQTSSGRVIAPVPQIR
jgi:hypothetical protein